ncbi:hypothetical protein ACP70R_027555 [Stipagrostis hirtigluma subsp. patula]
MSSNRGASKAAKSTINYHRLSLDEHHLFQQDALLPKDRDANHHSLQSPRSGSTYTDRRLTTPHLVSALTGIWNLVGQPEPSVTTERSEGNGISHSEDPVFFSRDQKGHKLTSSCAQSSGSPSSHNTPGSVYKDLISVKKMLMLTPFSCVVDASSTWRHVRSVNKVGGAQYLQCGITYSMQTEQLERTGTSESSKRSMSKETYIASTNMCSKDNKWDDNHSTQTRSMPAEVCTISSEEVNTTHDYERRSLQEAKSSLEIFREDPSFSACSIQQTDIGKETRVMPGNQISSKPCAHVQLDELTGASCLVGDGAVVNSASTDEYAYGSDMWQQDNHSPELQPTFQHQFDGAVTVNRHAVAGALAGTVVSVSLHPVDTVKTIIQANSSGQNSFYHTLRRTLVERGILGLYGGLASKLACSAPISAIYTLTYEIVKGSLLPILPKEYHSIAHCAAGGCSSIATSFVFTPSEYIKQQMQVGSQYQNCWNALVGCLRRGGIASLYAGWGAVLCRNIPHSIVKFYAYESLKQFLLESGPANAKLDSGQTLLCGGLAGSTAALFTTPFDVVKTRVQLQALSPVNRYEGVLHALKEIFRQEGLRGLYRGLTPRLAIYISQGAIFFTSYEFLKTIMFPEQELPARSS